MARVKYQNFAVDDSGDVISGAAVEVRDSAGTLATLYAAETGSTQAYSGVNPFTAGDGDPDKIGFVEFWVDEGAYTIAVGAGASQVTYRFEAIAAATVSETAAAAVHYYDTKADADDALSGLPDGRIVNVFVDEDWADRTTTYRVESSALNLKRYIDDPFVTIERLGGKGDDTFNNSPIVAQAVTDWGDSDLSIYLTQGTGQEGEANWRNAPGAYLFEDTIDLPVHGRFMLRGIGFNVVKFDASSTGQALFEIQAGSADNGGFHFEDLHINTQANEGKFIVTDPDGGVERFNTFTMQRLEFKGANYVVDMATDYCNSPHIDTVDIIGNGVGFRWAGDNSNFVTSSGTINKLHIATGGGSNRLRGPMLWLEGWGGLTGCGNILEGTSIMPETGFETAGSQTVSALYLKDCASYRHVTFGAHLELVQQDDAPSPGVHGGSTDYDIFIHNPSGGNRKNIRTTLTGGLESVPPHRLRAENATGNEFGVLTLDGGGFEEDMSQVDIVGPVEVRFRNPSTSVKGAGHFANPKISVDGNVNAGISGSATTETVHLPNVSTLAYSYKGGWFGNDAFPVQLTGSLDGDLLPRYVQHDPVYGHTILIDGTTDNQELSLSRCAIPANGERMTCFIMARAVMTTGLASGNASMNARGNGGTENYNLGGIMTNPDDLTPLVWTPFLGQDFTADDWGDGGDEGTIRLPSLDDMGGWYQVSTMALSFGRGAVAAEQPSGVGFVCHEDPYYNVGNAYSPARGTVIAGDTVISKGYSSDYVDRWVCTAEGTDRTISTTYNATGTTTITDIAAPTQLVPGDFVTVNSVSRRVLSVDYSAATAVLDGNAATGTGFAIANDAPTWEARWNGKVQTGSGSPSGSVTPVAVGQVYQDTTGPTAYMATGLTNTDWVALN